jgi:hypothetical protein
MFDLNLDLKLLRGLPIQINKPSYIGMVHPVTINDIVNLTIEKYYEHLNVLCVDSEDIKKFLNITDEIQTFEFLYINSCKTPDYRKIVLDALMFFFKEDVFFHENIGFYMGDVSEKRFINQDNFEDVKYVIKKLNCIESKEDDEFNCVSEKAKAILERMKKTRKKLEQAKADEEGEEPLTLFDLISILAAYSNTINVFNVWELTFFQFNNQFNRLKILKDYEVNIQVLMNTTEPDKVKYQHWLSKITKN